MSAEDIPQAAIPEDEYQKGVTTNQFLEAATDAQESINHMTGHVHVDQKENGTTVRTTGSGDAWSTNYWPDERARQVVQKVSENADSGLDYDAAQKVDDLRDEANRVNAAHDVVTSNGSGAKQVYDEARVEQRLKGDNSVGMSQDWGAMERGAGRKYDIKQGEAMRGRSKDFKRLNTGPADDSGEGEYEPFAPQHQEAAKEAMQSLAEKRMRRANEQQRHDEVKAAKAVLGRAGVKIPKPAEQPPTPPADQLDIAA